jgi:hypothetical protein
VNVTTNIKLSNSTILEQLILPFSFKTDKLNKFHKPRFRIRIEDDREDIALGEVSRHRAEKSGPSEPEAA